MSKRKIILVIAIVSLTGISGNKVWGQETMIDQVSNLFLEKLIATAKANYPRMKGARSRTESAKTNIGKQGMSWFDSFGFTYVYHPENSYDLVSPSFFNGYQVGIAINLGAILRTPFNVKQAKSEFRAAQADEAEYNLTLEAEVKQRYYAYIQALNIMKLRSNALLDAESMVRDVRSHYEKSEVSFADYNQALMSFTNSKEGKIQAEANWLQAKAALEELLTVKLEEVK